MYSVWELKKKKMHFNEKVRRLAYMQKPLTKKHSIGVREWMCAVVRKLVDDLIVRIG